MSRPQPGDKLVIEKYECVNDCKGYGQEGNHNTSIVIGDILQLQACDPKEGQNMFIYMDSILTVCDISNFKLVERKEYIFNHQMKPIEIS